MATINVKGTSVTVYVDGDKDFMSRTDMLKAQHGDFFLSGWLRNRNTVELMGIWEQVHNPDFNDGGFAGELDQALSTCPAMVTVTGYEPALLQKVAHAVAQAALDSIALALDQPDIFVFQILGSGRAEPFHRRPIVGTPEGLGFPGVSKTRRGPRLDPEQTGIARTRTVRGASGPCGSRDAPGRLHRSRYGQNGIQKNAVRRRAIDHLNPT